MLMKAPGRLGMNRPGANVDPGVGHVSSRRPGVQPRHPMSGPTGIAPVLIPRDMTRSSGWAACKHESLPSRSCCSGRSRVCLSRETASCQGDGCGNARLASFLAAAGFSLNYVGVDSNAALLRAARHRLAPESTGRVELAQADFLATDSPGESLPEGPFAFVALFGVLHHVPGRDWRLGLLRALAERTRPGGLLALAAWQFAGRDRFARRTVPWRELGPVLGEQVDTQQLEAGDVLLRFGPDPDLPPRYCHQVADAELDCIEENLSQLGLELQGVGDFRADGSEGDLNRYLVLRKREALTAHRRVLQIGSK